MGNVDMLIVNVLNDVVLSVVMVNVMILSVDI